MSTSTVFEPRLHRNINHKRIRIFFVPTDAGRKALNGTDALSNIRKFCESCPNDKYFDEVLMRALGLMCLAYGKHKLPFKDLTSPARFDVPMLKRNGEAKESGTSSDEDDPDDPEPDHGEDDGGDSKLDDEEIDEDLDETPVDTETCLSDAELEEDGLDLDESPGSSTSLRGTKSEGRTLGAGAGDKTGPQRPRDGEPPPPADRKPIDISSYEVKLADLAQLFKELDGKVGDTSDFFSNFTKNKDSLVIGFLGRTITKQVPGVVPKATLNYSWLTEHPHCKFIASRAFHLEISRSPDLKTPVFLLLSDIEISISIGTISRFLY
jgi:hypothetical protein